MPNRALTPTNKMHTAPGIPAGPGATGWWLYMDKGVHHAMPMRNAVLKGAWPSNMTWTYDPGEVREWLYRNAK